MESNSSLEDSSASRQTFRDTEIEEDTATSLLSMQSLSSIVNEPRPESVFRQLQQLVGATSEYRPLKESAVPESYSLPKIAFKDFSEYLAMIKEVSKLLLV
jgi:hypothetical protein